MRCREGTSDVLGLALAALASAGGTATGAPAPAIVARARYLMGTRLSITLPAPAPDTAFEAAFAEVARLEDALSNWREASEISRLNAAAAEGPVRCSPDLFGAVRAALHWAEETGGAFDPTVEPLVRAYGLRGAEGRLPDGAGSVPAAASDGAPGSGAPIGWRHVRIAPDARTIAFDARGVGIDLGGIGKGFALDAAARVLRRRGIRVALLDFGGQVLAIGSPPGGGGWPVGIASPEDRERPIAWIAVRDRSVATSSNSERAVAGPSGQVGHILDPQRGVPAGYAGSVTIVARDATTADALSTGLFVMGPERGSRWAAARELAVLFLWRRADGVLEHRSTPPFETLRRNGSRPAAGRAANAARTGS